MKKPPHFTVLARAFAAERERRLTLTKLAVRLGLSHQAVSLWLKKGVPPKHVLQVEDFFEGRITRHEIRPDLYPRD